MKWIRGNILWAVVVFVHVSLVAAPAAQAYIDPGTGSYIFQLVVGLLLGLTLTVKMFWRRITGLIFGRSRARSVKGD